MWWCEVADNDFAGALKNDIRIDARRVFVAAVRQLEDEFKSSPPGSVRSGVGAGGRVPYDTGDLQASSRTSGFSLTTDLLRAEFDVTATRNGFEYPTFLNDRETVGGSRATGRSAKYLSTLKNGGAPVSNVHFKWFEDWLLDGGSGDRFGRALDEQFQRIG